MTDLTPVQEDMLSFLHLKEFCAERGFWWSICFKKTGYIVDISSASDPPQHTGGGETIREAVFKAIHQVGLAELLKRK